MSLSDIERNTMVRLGMEKAYEFYADAELLLEKQRLSSAAGRLYYAVFHMLSALFVHDGLAVKTHKGLAIMFYQHYVNTGKVPIEYGDFLSRLESAREKADYDCYYKMEVETLNKNMSLAHEMMDTIGSMLQEDRK